MSKQLILLNDVEGLGIVGDVVNVADGHARNYLLPQGLAKPVTDKLIEKYPVIDQFLEYHCPFH